LERAVRLLHGFELGAEGCFRFGAGRFPCPRAGNFGLYFDKFERFLTIILTILNVSSYDSPGNTSFNEDVYMKEMSRIAMAIARDMVIVD
jgi:hypothetical protein